jgi:hypothetical protein
VARHAGDGPLHPSLMISSGRRDPPNGFALAEQSICSPENLSSDRKGEPSPHRSPRGTEKSLNAPAPPSNRFLCPPLCGSCGRNTGGTVQDFPGDPRRPSLRTLRDGHGAPTTYRSGPAKGRAKRVDQRRTAIGRRPQDCPCARKRDKQEAVNRRDDGPSPKALAAVILLLGR